MGHIFYVSLGWHIEPT